MCAREEAVAFISAMIKSRHECVAHWVYDQTAFAIAVCSGLSGLGKTRLLDEWQTFSAKAGVEGTAMGVLVMYANGHALCGADTALSVEAAFAWRLLHRAFLEDNGAELTKFFTRVTLLANADDLTLEKALHLLYAGAVKTNALVNGEMLSLFVGMDEYQVLTDDALLELVSCLQNCKQLKNVRIYPLFAGTDWSKMSIALPTHQSPTLSVFRSRCFCLVTQSIPSSRCRSGRIAWWTRISGGECFTSEVCQVLLWRWRGAKITIVSGKRGCAPTGSWTTRPW